MSLNKRVILDQCLLEQIPKSKALIGVRLHLAVVLSMFAHLDILLELLDLPILHLILQLHLSVLALELLHEE